MALLFDRMAAPVTDDVILSHAYLNLIHAGFQGNFVFINALAQAGYDGPPPLMAQAKEIAEALDWVKGLMEKLWLGEPAVLHGNEDPSGLSEVVEKFLGMLKEDNGRCLKAFAHNLNVLCKEPTRSSACVAAALLAGQAYQRQHFINGLVLYGEKFGLADVADRWRQRTLLCQQDVALAHGYLGRLIQGPYPEGRFFFDLWNECVNLSGLLNSQHNDMLEVEGMRRGGYTFERAQLPAEDIEGWKRLGLGPSLAGHWYAFGLRPPEAALWISEGFADAALIGAWRVRGFPLPEAKQLSASGLGPAKAYVKRIFGDAA